MEQVVVILPFTDLASNSTTVRVLHDQRADECHAHAAELAERKVKGQEANDSSLLHQLDLALRRRTGERMTAAVGESNRRALAQRCSEARQAAMAACREACAAGQTWDGGGLSVEEFATMFERRLNTQCQQT